MRSIVFRSLLALGCLRAVVAQYAFSVPEPAVADFNSVNDVVQGTVVNIAWIANSTYQPTLTGDKLLDSNGEISLWITSYENNDYTHCLTPRANSETGGTWAWNITLSDDDIDANHGKFVYRLKPTVTSQNSPFNTTEDECPSRGFTIRKAADVLASSSASVASAASAARASASKSANSANSATATTTSGSTATATSGSASATGATMTGAPTSTGTGSPSSSDNGGLSGGAKAGIAIGVIAVVAIAAVAAFLLWRRRRGNTTGSKAAELSGTAQYAEAPPMQDKHVYGYAEPPQQHAVPVELADSQAHAPVELPASMK